MRSKLAHRLVTGVGAALSAVVLVPAAPHGAEAAGVVGRPVSAPAATLVVSPNPVAAGDAFHGSGCGYTIGKQVNVTISNAAWTAFYPVGVDSSGCVSFMYRTDRPGTYTIRTSQNLKGQKQTVMGTAELTAV